MTLNVPNPKERLPADQKFYKQQTVVDRNFAFIDHVSTVYYWGQDGYAHTNRHA